MMKEVWVGIDQSYTDTGIAVVCEGKVRYAGSIKFGKVTKHVKRKIIRQKLSSIVTSLKGKYKVSVCIEAIRLFSGKQPHISTNYIFSACALVGAIVDVCSDLGVEVYWVETRSWKKDVLGSCKPSGKTLSGVKDTNKVDAIDYVIGLGMKDSISYVVNHGKNKGETRYNDNVADAVCIAICGSNGSKIKELEDF